jgi:hypothetical protein
MQPQVENNENEQQENENPLNRFLNLDYGVIGRTASTKSEANTSSEFQFWVADRDEAIGRIEIGNIVGAYSDDRDDITFGIVTKCAHIAMWIVLSLIFSVTTLARHK